MGRGGGGGGRGVRGMPINSEASLNRFLKANPDDPLAQALTDFDNNLVMLDFDTGLYVVDVQGVKDAAKSFVKQSQDISYSKNYLIGLAQEDALATRGVVLSKTEATRYYNEMYQTKSRAILAASRAGGVNLSDAQRTRLQSASRGGYLSLVYATASSERGSLANASLGTRRGGGGVMTDAARREARRNFLEITGRLR